MEGDDTNRSNSVNDMHRRRNAHHDRLPKRITIVFSEAAHGVTRIEFYASDQLCGIYHTEQLEHDRDNFRELTVGKNRLGIAIYPLPPADDSSE
jgi:hypothetical protein